jgi:hypothetical protein
VWSIIGALAEATNLDAHLESLQAYADAGVDELFVQQIGPELDAFFDEWGPAVLGRFGQHATAGATR